MPKVSLVENGPILISNFSKIVKMKDGTEIEVSTQAALCRCGHSKNKPFCDGAHAAAGFTDSKKEGRTPNKVDSYDGEKVSIQDNRGLCAHAGYCTTNLPSVFKYGEEPWIDPNGASSEEIATVVKQCPAGALAAQIDGQELSGSNAEQNVAYAPNGPYIFGGGCELDGVEPQKGATGSKKALCRCGKSLNKPFCNGAHHNVNFDEDVG
ncbi:MAG: CDGSH iron-sulfur domain-containing protein [Planctomycetes bacterium]|nr:CDGSH iron-sulfur domain-containing protein [Planctomycetota bacterium]